MKSKLALVFTLLSVGALSYLTFHYYDLYFALSPSDSVCNLNSTFNCDVVTASSYSAFAGIPIALWGAVTNIVLALLILLGILDWTTDSTTHKRYTLWLAAGTAAVSIVMGSISTLLISTFCLFCITSYVCSFATLILLRLDMPPVKNSLLSDLSSLVGASKKYLVYIAAIPLMTLFFHKSYVNNMDRNKVGQGLESVIAEWQSNPVNDFSSIPAAITKGNENAKMIISEFADFRCTHCKEAAPVLSAFAGSRKDVLLKYYAFPLDGSCNSALKSGGDGISCLLAKNVFCAEKVSKKGWALHDHIYDSQMKINTLQSFDAVKDLMRVAYKTLQIPEEEQLKCIDLPETDQSIRLQAQTGENSGVRGTPTIYVNGKRLPRGQTLPVLERAYNALE